MIRGLGVDLVSIERFAQTLERSPGVAERTLTQDESQVPIETLAGRFAAKEALAKAVGPHRFAWHDVEISVGTGGEPVFIFTEAAHQVLSELEITTVHLSITHEHDYAAAFVIAESR